MFEIEVKPGTQAYQDLSYAMVEGGSVTLVVFEPKTVRRFEPGDRVRVQFDDGMGPAEVVFVGTVSGGEEYVEVKYGPGGKYRTNLPKHAVVTENVEHIPGRVEVKR